MKKVLVEISRIVLGATFVFSGFVKSVDPYGTAYKVSDYLKAFDLSTLSFLEMPISFFLCGFEFALGIAILLGIYRKWSSLMMLLTMCFMTPLTLYLAIANPVSDCGCFGDALVISNWETFYKNIVLLILAIFLFLNHQLITPLFGEKTQKYVLGYLAAFSILFLSYNYYFDPIIDFRPYKTGVNLPQQMELKDDMRPIEENIFVYEKEGIQKEFTEDNYPWEDSTWTYVSMETKIIKEGQLPPISDFAVGELIFNADKSEIIDQYDITEDVINDGNYTFIIVAPFLKDISVKDREKLISIIDYSELNGYNSIMLTASTTEEILATKKSFPDYLKMGITDEKVLKTIIRSNPSLMLIKDGNILSKWANPSMPKVTELNKPIEQLIEGSSSRMGSLSKILTTLLIFIIPLIGIRFAERKTINK